MTLPDCSSHSQWQELIYQFSPPEHFLPFLFPYRQYLSIYLVKYLVCLGQNQLHLPVCRTMPCFLGFQKDTWNLSPVQHKLKVNIFQSWADTNGDKCQRTGRNNIGQMILVWKDIKTIWLHSYQLKKVIQNQGHSIGLHWCTAILQQEWKSDEFMEPDNTLCKC